MISYCVFFFKQKTAYERRISDWSSDVCSSDLAPPSPDGIRAGTACRDLHSHTRMRTNRLGRSAPCRRILAHDRNSNPPHMTPSSRPSDRRASGNPATQANINQTVKQQREQKRQEKLAEYQRQLAKRRRGKIVWWVVGSTAAVAIVALVVASFVFAPQGAPTYGALDSEGIEIEGVETFENETTHVEGTVDYAQSPPAGGPHNSVWLNCGIHTEPQTNENAVHSMEHGAIWVTYDADARSEGHTSELQSLMRISYAV